MIEGGGDTKPKPEETVGVDEQLLALKAQGMLARDAVREVVRRSGRPRQEISRRWLALASDEEGNPSVS